MLPPYKYLSYLALLLTPIWHVSPAGASCGTASCPLDVSRNQNHLLDAKPAALTLQLTFERIDQDQPRFGADKVAFGQIRRPDHDEIKTENNNVRLLAEYALNRRLSFSLTLPLLKRVHSHLANPAHGHDGDHSHDHVGKLADDDLGGELESWNFTRLGDLTAWSHWAPWPHLLSNKADFSLDLGIGLPTGATGVRNDQGQLAEPSLQPGRGAFALLLDSSFEFRQQNAPFFAGHSPARYFASTFYRINFKGKDDYQFGNEWVFHLGGQYPLWRRVDLLGQFVGRWNGRDEPGATGQRTDATGGTFVYLSPGLQFDLGQGVSLYGYYQVPVYQNVNQVQITSNRNLLVGLGYRLKLLSKI